MKEFNQEYKILYFHRLSESNNEFQEFFTPSKHEFEKPTGKTRGKEVRFNPILPNTKIIIFIYYQTRN